MPMSVDLWGLCDLRSDPEAVANSVLPLSGVPQVGSLRFRENYLRELDQERFFPLQVPAVAAADVV